MQSLIQELGVDVAFVERLDSDSGNIVTLVRDIFHVSLITAVCISATCAACIITTTIIVKKIIIMKMQIPGCTAK